MAAVANLSVPNLQDNRASTQSERTLNPKRGAVAFVRLLHVRHTSVRATEWRRRGTVAQKGEEHGGKSKCSGSRGGVART